VGLGRKKEKCFVISGNGNVADGMVNCADRDASKWSQEGYTLRGELDVETMDRMLHEDYFMLKIDVEGAEPRVLSKEGSAAYFSKHKIQYMMTEAWNDPHRLEYFKRLDSLGYTLQPVNYDRGAGEEMVNNMPIINNLLSQGAEAVANCCGGVVDFFAHLPH